MKNPLVFIVLILITITGCSKSPSEVDAVAAKARFDATYNHDKIMKLSSPEAEAERLKKFQ